MTDQRTATSEQPMTQEQVADPRATADAAPTDGRPLSTRDPPRRAGNTGTQPDRTTPRHPGRGSGGDGHRRPALHERRRRPASRAVDRDPDRVRGLAARRRGEGRLAGRGDTKAAHGDVRARARRARGRMVEAPVARDRGRAGPDRHRRRRRRAIDRRAATGDSALSIVLQPIALRLIRASASPARAPL